MKIRQNLLLFGATALLSACGHYSEDLAALDKQLGNERDWDVASASNQDLNNIMTAAGGEMQAISFNEALAREYHALAKAEQEAMDYKSAKMFTEKARAAMNGEQVEPAAASTPEGEQRRAALVNAIAMQMIPKNYYSLARAQAQYDSWQEQKGEADPQAANHCRDNFEQAMMALENPFMETKTYAVLFSDQTNTVSPEAQRILNEIAAFISEGNHTSYQLILSGGPDQIAAVKNKLLQMKFMEQRILIGEKPTADNAVQIDVLYAAPQNTEDQSI